MEGVGMTISFDRAMTGLEGMPGVRKTPPSTLRATPPFGSVTTHIVQMYRIDELDEEDRILDSRLACFMQVLDGGEAIEVVMPDEVVRRIVAQYERLHDRSTPDSRQRRRRTRELTVKRRGDHDKGRHAKRRNGACSLCQAEAPA